ncbi:MAG TPA: MaoC family dehydratase N-terminal domain-containing protein [Steroidobacter sp.]
MSANSPIQSAPTELDLSDITWRVGHAVGGGQVWEACTGTDIRRWVQALDYPNPIHWNEPLARESKLGGLIAPQSFTVCMDYGHGVHPACVGKLPGSHLIFGGEEWWFYGTHIRPADRLTQTRRFDGYKVADTKFAGPTLFSRGDTVHRNQHGALIAKERSTSIRYLAEEANRRGVYNNQQQGPRKWKPEELREIYKTRHEWILSNRAGKSPHYEEVKVGDKLPRRVIGPHTLVSFANEYRAFMFNPWGNWHWTVPEGVTDPWTDQDAGFTDGFSYDPEIIKIDPRMRDGLFTGPSSGHINPDRAGKIGMFRAYGYGATMGAWFHDYVAYWAGHDGYIWHSKSQFRSPAFEGDVTFIDGEVIEKRDSSPYGMPVAVIRVQMTSQDGGSLVDATAEVQLPH